MFTLDVYYNILLAPFFVMFSEVIICVFSVTRLLSDKHKNVIFIELNMSRAALSLIPT